MCYYININPFGVWSLTLWMKYWKKVWLVLLTNPNWPVVNLHVYCIKALCLPAFWKYTNPVVGMDYWPFMNWTHMVTYIENRRRHTKLKCFCSNEAQKFLTHKNLFFKDKKALEWKVSLLLVFIKILCRIFDHLRCQNSLWLWYDEKVSNVCGGNLLEVNRNANIVIKDVRPLSGQQQVKKKMRNFSAEKFIARDLTTMGSNTLLSSNLESIKFTAN